MIAIPAIDLHEGACVQLGCCPYNQERIRLQNPVAVARNWVAIGFRQLHVVDLDAATGTGDNSAVIDAILDESDTDLRVGGGIQSGDRVEELLNAGAFRVIVGTRAIENSDWLADLATAHPGRIILAADVCDRRVVTPGWTRAQSRDIQDLLADIEPLAIAGVLVTAVHREGQMAGPDLALMQDLTESTHLPIIASGGIAGLDDLRALQHRGVAATVIGTALYTGALDPVAVSQEFFE